MAPVWQGEDGLLKLLTTAGAGELLYSKLATKRHLVGTRIKVDGAVVHDDRPFEAFCAQTLEPATRG